MQNLTIIDTKIKQIRNNSIILDRDIAEFYGVETKHINQAVKNNPDKFPLDFCFELTNEEWKILKSKNLTSSWGGVRKSPKAFTEQGVYMLATILKSKNATQVSIAIMRAFAEMRKFSTNYSEIINKLNTIDNKLNIHDKELDAVILALDELMQSTTNKVTHKIGFI